MGNYIFSFWIFQQKRKKITSNDLVGAYMLINQRMSFTAHVRENMEIHRAVKEETYGNLYYG